MPFYTNGVARIVSCETGTTQGGTRFANLRVVSNDKRGDDEYPVWINVNFYGGIVDAVIEKYIVPQLGNNKKPRAEFNGKLRQDNWEDKETGAKRSKIEMLGADMNLLDWPDSGNSDYDDDSV